MRGTSFQCKTLNQRVTSDPAKSSTKRTVVTNLTGSRMERNFAPGSRKSETDREGQERRREEARRETWKSPLDRFLWRGRGDPFLSPMVHLSILCFLSPPPPSRLRRVSGLSLFSPGLAGFPWLPFLPWPNKLVVTKESRSRPAGWLAGVAGVAGRRTIKLPESELSDRGTKLNVCGNGLRGAREPVGVNSLHECPRIGHNLASEWKPTGMNGIARPRPRRVATKDRLMGIKPAEFYR